MKTDPNTRELTQLLASVLSDIHDAGQRGKTWAEVAPYKWDHGRVSSALTILCDRGHVLRLEERRGKSSVYVTKAHQHGRPLSKRRKNRVPVLLETIEKLRSEAGNFPATPRKATTGDEVAQGLRAFSDTPRARDLLMRAVHWDPSRGLPSEYDLAKEAAEKIVSLRSLLETEREATKESRPPARTPLTTEEQDVLKECERIRKGKPKGAILPVRAVYLDLLLREALRK